MMKILLKQILKKLKVIKNYHNQEVDHSLKKKKKKKLHSKNKRNKKFGIWVECQKKAKINLKS